MGEVSLVSPLLRGRPVRPTADTTHKDPPLGDKEQRIHKLIREGMSERMAREEVRGKGRVAP